MFELKICRLPGCEIVCVVCLEHKRGTHWYRELKSMLTDGSTNHLICTDCQFNGGYDLWLLSH